LLLLVPKDDRWPVYGGRVPADVAGAQNIMLARRQRRGCRRRVEGDIFVQGRQPPVEHHPELLEQAGGPNGMACRPQA